MAGGDKEKKEVNPRPVPPHLSFAHVCLRCNFKGFDRWIVHMVLQQVLLACYMLVADAYLLFV